MRDQTLVNAFDDCVERMAAGAPLEECVKAYPEFAQELIVMLETGALIRRAQPSSHEIAIAQERVRLRLE